METIVALLNAYQLPTVFWGAFFFGDSVILTAAYLAGQLGWQPLPIFLAAFLGTAAADTLWFLGGVVLSRRFASSTFLLREREKASALVQKLTGRNPLYALILVKFLYGTRIAMILYTAARRIPFHLFSLYNSVGILVWLAIFFPLGYFAGKGLGAALPDSGVIQTAIVVFIISAVIMRIVTVWLTRRVTNE
ncbi:MAG TPA: VTT domain-containing protein [Candidatus Paceibacterota bacterium]|nr:VTT domain-containing protein [Candidatus Paceibacterota bacterium]